MEEEKSMEENNKIIMDAAQTTIEQEKHQEKDLSETKKKYDKRKVFSLILKGSKIIALIGMYYAAIIMYQLGNFNEAVIIGFAATFFLILNKLESTWG